MVLFSQCNSGLGLFRWLISNQSKWNLNIWICLQQKRTILFKIIPNDPKCYLKSFPLICLPCSSFQFKSQKHLLCLLLLIVKVSWRHRHTLVKETGCNSILVFSSFSSFHLLSPPCFSLASLPFCCLGSGLRSSLAPSTHSSQDMEPGLRQENFFRMSSDPLIPGALLEGVLPESEGRRDPMGPRHPSLLQVHSQVSW